MLRVIASALVEKNQALAKLAQSLHQEKERATRLEAQVGELTEALEVARAGAGAAEAEPELEPEAEPEPESEPEQEPEQEPEPEPPAEEAAAEPEPEGGEGAAEAEPPADADSGGTPES
jgi:septal ring factor EnvC (AmiA/AmiB activator)